MLKLAIVSMLLVACGGSQGRETHAVCETGMRYLIDPATGAHTGTVYSYTYTDPVNDLDTAERECRDPGTCVEHVPGMAPDAWRPFSANCDPCQPPDTYVPAGCEAN